MRFTVSAATLLPLALATFANAVRPDNTKLVLENLKIIDKNIHHINASLSKIPDDQQPTIDQGLKLLEESNVLDNHIDRTTNRTFNSRAFNNSESKTIFLYVKDTIQTDTDSLLQNFIDHFPGFNAAGFAGIVENVLQDIQGRVDILAANLTEKSHQPYKRRAPAVAQAIHDKFDEAINVYSQGSS